MKIFIMERTMLNRILALALVLWSGCAPALESKPVTLDAQTCARMARAHSGGNPSAREDAAIRAQDRYYRYLMNQDMLPLVRDVKDNFEKAVEKAEERFDSEDVNISQSDILKLRLGLIGAKKDLNEIEKDRDGSRLELLEVLGLGRTSPVKFPKKGLVRIRLNLPSLDACLETARKHHSRFSPLRIELAYIDLRDAERNVRFLKKGRRYSRGLLVVALANFDMGIGEGRELFEALYIYNRSVRDYVKAVYRFNMAVTRLSGAIGRDLVEMGKTKKPE